MVNWVTVLRVARDLVERAPLEHTPNGDEPALHPALLILRSLADATKLTDEMNLRFNLDTAAIYLLRLLSGSPEEGQLVDLKAGTLFDDLLQYRYIKLLNYYDIHI